MKMRAFTLAETLIVIGIIGVVAALTLPNLNHATGDKERVTKVKKIYSSLTEAFDRAQAIYGDFDTWFNDNPDYLTRYERLGKRVTEFMKISKDCGIREPRGCFADTKVLSLDGSTYTNSIETGNYNNGYKIITSDGVSILFMANEKFIFADIDGPQKGKNQMGTDIFYFVIDSDKNMIYPFGQSGIYAIDNTSSADLAARTFKFGMLAAYWIIQNDNADYLKADTNGKCNNSDIVLNWTTNTSCH